MEKHPFDENIIAPTFPATIVGIALVISLASFTWFAYYAHSTSVTLNNIFTRDFRAIELGGKIMQLDEVLTMSARMAASTGDLFWEKRYNKYDPVLVDAINEASTLIDVSDLGESAKKTEEANNKLVTIERQSFQLVREGKNDRAKQLLFGSEYEEQKVIYAEGMEKFGALLESKARSYLDKKIAESRYMFIIIFIDLVVNIIAWFLTYHSIMRWKKALEKASHIRLKYKDQMIVAAKKAGMAEIATSVVHNIGNILNSVNISTSRLYEITTRSNLNSLSELSKLMENHKDDWANFLISDKKGKAIPQFIELLDKRWQIEKNDFVTELKLLENNVSHIKKVIATHQSLSGLSALIEPANLSEVLDHSLDIISNLLKLDNLVITRDYQINNPIYIDVTKVQQILVNLIKNAIESMEKWDNNNKKLTIRSYDYGDNFSVEIIDNGSGISPENLVTIFSYGFTTKTNGHGFGLHMCANQAKEMGGSLQAKNNTNSNGATFTLTLPKKCE